ncbi:MAG: HAD-IIA family hydrolase [Streptosporangiaceae bacterium]
MATEAAGSIPDRSVVAARDVPSSVVERLRAARGFLFDMDGTLVLGDRRNHGLRPLPGALDITRWLAERPVPYVVFTNGTGRTPGEYAATLREVGFGVADDAVMTPASSAVDLFLRRGHRRVLVLGTEGLTRPLREAGIDAVPPRAREQGRPGADAVLVGLYREFTMDDLEAACHAVWAGATLYSCSQSVFFATAEGRALGTSRAICAMITSVTGRRPRVVGKPSRDALRSAGHRLGVPTRDLAVVGDDPVLEVPMAHRGDSLAVAVGTGIGADDAYARLPEGARPHLVMRGIDEFLALCREVDAATLTAPIKPSRSRRASGPE